MTATWTIWLGGIAATFAVFEGFALYRGKKTFSGYVVDFSRDWPIAPFVGGLVAGGLAAHFWWSYCA